MAKCPSKMTFTIAFQGNHVDCSKKKRQTEK